MTVKSKIPDLEERFLEPPGWRWHSFKYTEKNGQERKIRFGTVSPQNTIPDAVVVCLPGLSEYSEKYFEVARTLLNKNMSFWILDWVGQGKSTRYLKNPHKRHSHGFEQDVKDIHRFILDYIKHSSVHPDKGRIPLAMLAHSMGANIGLRYLEQYPETFECAALSAPMIGFKDLSHIPKPLGLLLTGTLSLLMGSSYLYGGGNWHNEQRPCPGHDAFSSDSIRGAIHDAWCLSNPDLQVGRITYGWLHEANKSCALLQKKKFLQNIQTHCLLAIAGHEDFVDNKALKKASSLIPNAKLLEFPNSFHEILMEKDDIRNAFFEAFHKLVKENIINRPETLKPF